MDERENQERRVGFILFRYAAQSQLESGLETVSKRIIRFQFNSRWHQATVLQCYAAKDEATQKAKDDFFERLSIIVEQVPSRHVKIWER